MNGMLSLKELDVLAHIFGNLDSDKDGHITPL